MTRPVLFVNPRAGDDEPTPDRLAESARELGVDVRVLRDGDDLVELARAADADVLGMAGGDGSLGAVAGVAVDRGLAFVCVPYGTRNHFAKDVGLDAGDPLAALGAFRAGDERRIDVGRVGERTFVNNVSLGLYARLVHRREHRRSRDEAFARVRALLLSLRDHGRTERFVIDGQPIRASVVLVANNRYRLDLFSVGARERLDEGALCIYAARGLRRLRWSERRAEQVTIEASRPRVRAAIDGEPMMLQSPSTVRVEPRALRLLVPRGQA